MQIFKIKTGKNAILKKNKWELVKCSDKEYIFISILETLEMLQIGKSLMF